jgi:hypothetical protein
MSDGARVLANRANARLSTGPRSPAGKARTARNAVRYGLNGDVLPIRRSRRKSPRWRVSSRANEALRSFSPWPAGSPRPGSICNGCDGTAAG